MLSVKESENQEESKSNQHGEMFHIQHLDRDEDGGGEHYGRNGESTKYEFALRNCSEYRTRRRCSA